MKHNKLILTAVAMLLSFVALAQDCRITASFSNVTLSKAMQVIEGTSAYSFFYDAAKVDLSAKVSLSAIDLPVEDAMKQMLSNVKVNFEIKGDQIVLIPENRTTTGPRIIKVTVLDKDDYPVIGAAVMKADGDGVVTDIDGVCSVEVDTSDKNLVVNCLGYKTETVSLGSASVIKVYLEEESFALDALVVVGDGSQKKGNLTGAISVVDSESI